MPTKPPVHELEFLKLCRNHAELQRNLTTIGLDGKLLNDYAQHIFSCWLGLAKEHLEDAQHALKAKRTRSTYSRAYYAAYNASKATRYLVQGSANLTGEDHKLAGPGLPDDFPNSAHWSQQIIVLYQLRLSADYDNWQNTAATYSIMPEAAVALAEAFLLVVTGYVHQKFGVKA